MRNLQHESRNSKMVAVAEFVRIPPTSSVAGSGGLADGRVFSRATVANQDSLGLHKTSQLSHDALGIISWHMNQ